MDLDLEKMSWIAALVAVPVMLLTWLFKPKEFLSFCKASWLLILAGSKFGALERGVMIRLRASRYGATVFVLRCAPNEDWWRRRELNPRPKQTNQPRLHA